MMWEGKLVPYYDYSHASFSDNIAYTHKGCLLAITYAYIHIHMAASSTVT